jgi:pimeloyl-ACP methyl ester carboxylesterase
MGEGGEALRSACRDVLAGGEKTKVYDLIVEMAYSPAWQEAKKAEIAERRAQARLLPDTWFEGLLGLLDALEGFDLRPHLGAVRCPVLVVSAEKDAVMPPERTEAAARAIRGAELVVLEGSGHAVFVEREAEFLALATRFLARVAMRAEAAS